MSGIAGFLMFCGGLTMVLSGWAFCANEITSRQRNMLLSMAGDVLDKVPPYHVYNLGYIGKYLEEFGAVPYDRHFWYVFTLRDPRNLYGNFVLNLWR